MIRYFSIWGNMESLTIKPKFMEDVHPNSRFYTWDGSVLNNISDLYDHLLNMDNLTYSHHVTKNKNDFHNWIKDVIKDQQLADNILQSSSREETRSLINERINQLVTKSDEPTFINSNPALNASSSNNKTNENSLNIIRNQSIINDKKSNLSDMTKKITSFGSIFKRDANNNEKIISTKNDDNFEYTKKGLFHQYTSRQILLHGFFDFSLGLGIGIVATLLLI